MERYLQDFEIESKNTSEEAQARWRKAAWLVKNPRRRFRYIVDLAQRAEAKKRRRDIQGRIRVLVLVKEAAIKFKEGVARPKPRVSDETLRAGFHVDPDVLASVVRDHDYNYLSERGVDGVARDLLVSIPDGIRKDEVHKRRKVFGANEHTENPPKSFVSFVIDSFHDLTLVILLVCAVVSVGVGIATEGFPKGIYDGLGIILSVCVVVVVTATSDYHQSLQFRDLDREKKKTFVRVTRDRRKQQVLIQDLVVGDVVELGIGDIVPADGIYTAGHGLVVDESSLTGESEPSQVHGNNPFILCGTKVIDGSGTMLVTAVGMKTEWGLLMETLSEGGEDETPLQVKLNGVSIVIGKIGLCFAFVTLLVLLARFTISKWLRGDIAHWDSSDALQLVNFFAIAVTIVVVAVPEGLPLAVTLSLAFAMMKLMKDRALVRHLSACETMGSADCICTDKTGTLTTNHMVVEKVWMLGGEVGEEITCALFHQCIFLNTGCDYSKDETGNTMLLGTPTEKAMVEFCSSKGGNFQAVRDEFEIVKVEPFNSERKKMTSLVALPEGGLRAFCKGAAEIVVRMCDKGLVRNGEVSSLSEQQFDEISKAIDSFATSALRTLCLAYQDIDGSPEGHVIPDSGYTFLAIVGIKDPLRPEVKDAVRNCKSAGITVRMVTGDNIMTAKAIARECGILTEEGLAINGPDFRSSSPSEMMGVIPRIQVLARSSPSDKHNLVTTLRNMGQVVAVTGDGTNDAPALREADIGLAMGIEGTEVAKDTADVIILDDNFGTIVQVVKWGRSVYVNIQKFVQFQLTVNIVALVMNFVSACITGSAPLTAVQLLWVNMIMDTLGALALATEPPNDALLNRPPVRKGDSFITAIMWRNVVGQSLYQLIVLGILYFDGGHLLRLESDTLDTFIFNAFVFCQVFNEVNSRDMEKVNVFKGLFGNKIFMSIIASTVIFQFVIVEYLGTFANTVPLSWQLWLISIMIGFVGMAVGALLKCVPVQRFQLSHDHYLPLPSGPDTNA